MLPLLSESGPIIKRIAAERGVTLPPIEGLKSAEDIAKLIIDCIYNPTAEVYTHAGSREFVSLASHKLEEAERQQIPVVLGEREVYKRLKKKTPSL